MVKRYVPSRGDLIWLQFSPQAGHEQAGRRPALVISPKTYNAKTGLALVCPLTSQVKGYPFEVTVEGGVVLADQVKSVDWRARNARLRSRAEDDAVAAVLGRVRVLLGDEIR